MPSIIDRSTHLVIRLVRRGCTNRPFYHIVVQKNREPVRKKVRDQIGAFDPMPNMHNELVMTMNFDRLQKWLIMGAEPTKPLQRLLGLSGYFPIHPTTRLSAFRKQRLLEAEVIKAQETEDTSSSCEQKEGGPSS